MERSRPPALDGGWGYLIVVSSFFVAFMLDGLESSYGLLLPSVLATYQANYFVATLCGGMITGVCLGLGPVTAILVRKFGCRPVAFTGGIITCISIVSATRAEAIEVFVLCYGVFAGTGIGLIYLPSITMINMYFNKKRGVAVGIVTSGSGVGLLVMAFVINGLMAEYGWRGCYLIIAGIYLHLCACACLMRPLEDNFTDGYADASEDPSEELKDDVTPQNGGILVENNAADPLIHDVKPKQENREPKFVHSGDTAPPSSSKVNSHLHCDGKDNCSPNGISTEISVHPNTTNCNCNGHLELSSNEKTDENILCNCQDQKLHEVLLATDDNKILLSSSVTSASSAPFSSSFLGAGILHHLDNHDPRQSHHNHPHHHHHRHHPHHHNFQESHSLHGSHFAMSDRSDADSIAIFDLPANKNALLNLPPECISMSTLSINTLRSRSKSMYSTKSRSVYSVIGRSHLTVKSVSKSSIEEEIDVQLTPVNYNPFSLFKIIRFDLFCVGAFLVQIAASIPAMFTPSYALSLGLESSTAANIVSILGISNTVGRLSAGLLANLGLGAVRIYNSGTFLAGVACYLLPFCTTYDLLVAFAVCHGFFIGFFPPLQSVILVEQLGIDRLSASFGIMCLCKSVASMVGPSLAGALYEAVGNYSVPYYFAGGMLTLSMILHCIMSFCPKT